MSGSEMQREKEKVAAKMREKQAAGMCSWKLYDFVDRGMELSWRPLFLADAKKAAEAAGGKKWR